MNLIEHTGCAPTFYSIGVIEFRGEQFDGFPLKVVFKADGSEKALYLFSLWETDSKFRPWAKVHFCPTCGKSAEEVIQTELSKLQGQSTAPVSDSESLVMRTFFFPTALDQAMRDECRLSGESLQDLVEKGLTVLWRDKEAEKAPHTIPLSNQ